MTDAPNYQAIETLIRATMSACGIPGLAILIGWGGDVLYREGFGFADLESKTVMGPAHRFAIGSITKAMTGLAVLQLTERGMIDLDKTIGAYLPDLPADVGSIAIHHLLDHTSGLVNFTAVPGFPEDAQMPFTREDILGWFVERPREFPSGERWSYGNSGHYLLGLLVEHCSGQQFDAYLDDHVFRPFGMDRTSLADWRPIVRDRAHGYVRRADGSLRNAARFDPVAAFSAGGVASTIDDLFRFKCALFGPASKIVADLGQRLSVRRKLNNGVQLPYLDNCLVASTFEGHRKLFHPGNISGFAAQFAYYPDKDLTIIVLTNLEGSYIPPASIEARIARLLLGVAPSMNEEWLLDEAAATRFSGVFEVRDIFYGFTHMRFREVDGRLQLGLGTAAWDGATVALKRIGDTRFAVAHDEEQWVLFDQVGRDLELYYGGGIFRARRHD